MRETKPIPLEELLDLVGTLDDSEGEDTAKQRLRRYLQRNVTDVGILRDYAETCLRNSGSQYNRALQDVVNRVGEMLGFAVAYGRYAGVRNQVGFDGHWLSPLGHHIIVEVKTTDVYAIKTATLLNYVNELVSQGEIPQDAPWLGLYVVGRLDAGLDQLHNAIVAEKRLQDLRTISVDSLLSLTELAVTYDVTHESVVAVLFPSGPRLDATVDLMASIVAQAEVSAVGEAMPVSTGEVSLAELRVSGEAEPAYYLAPVKWKEFDSPMDAVGKLITTGKWGFGERTPLRRSIKPGDWICFYASGLGVFAHAQITTAPQHNPLPDLQRHSEAYPWTFDIAHQAIYEDNPVAITAAVRSQLDAFANLDVSRNWGWFVTATCKLSEHDFKILTRQVQVNSPEH